MTGNTINASPTKSFFVDMLTRDILLEDAILDLLDNCVDGIQRINAKKHDERDADTAGDGSESKSPYSGYFARISFDGNSFSIEDNCGGIPLEVAKKYALRMGRPSEEEIGEKIDEDLFVIGTYGIGMKRAIFKMGRESTIDSQTETDSFTVEISPEWLTNVDSWELGYRTNARDTNRANGTNITVRHLKAGVSEDMTKGVKSKLHNDLYAKISENYSYIIEQGFKVYLNDQLVVAKPIALLWGDIGNSNFIAPYMYIGEINGVEVSMSIGLYRPIPTEEEIEEESKGTRYSSTQAGITVVVNDRVILYCDKTRLTGWGDMKVPSYHHQFIAVSGVVHFRSSDQSKLPITTTKRGVDASNDTFLNARNFMREGLRIFTAYTNEWKKDLTLAKRMTEEATPRAVPQRAGDTSSLSVSWKGVRDSATAKGQKQFVPSLPKISKPDGMSDQKTIKYQKSAKEIEFIASDLLDNRFAPPNEVGIACFEYVLQRLKA